MEIKSTNGRTVRDIIAAHACVHIDEVTPTAKPTTDLGLDSLDSVELCMKLENEFYICIPDEEWDKCETVEDIENLMKSRQS
jgi:acyl carrier protein